jgi:hypothetical protein
VITQSELKEILDYDKNTGIFTCKKKRKGTKGLGRRAGSKRKDGYCVIRIGGKDYYAHRLAWLYVYGYFPENYLDHKNRDPYDNRISNLREVSPSCNLRNTGNPCDNKTGVKGVYLNKKWNMWNAGVRVNGKTKHLGYYKDFEDAVCARLAFEQCVGWSGCDSSSPAFKYVKKMQKEYILKNGA